VSDNRRFKTVLEQAEMNANNSSIIRVLADGAYDTRDDFNLLEEKRIEAGIKT